MGSGCKKKREHSHWPGFRNSIHGFQYLSGSWCWLVDDFVYGVPDSPQERLSGLHTLNYLRAQAAFTGLGVLQVSRGSDAGGASGRCIYQENNRTPGTCRSTTGD